MLLGLIVTLSIINILYALYIPVIIDNYLVKNKLSYDNLKNLFIKPKINKFFLFYKGKNFFLYYLFKGYKKENKEYFNNKIYFINANIYFTLIVSIITIILSFLDRYVILFIFVVLFVLLYLIASFNYILAIFTKIAEINNNYFLRKKIKNLELPKYDIEEINYVDIKREIIYINQDIKNFNQLMYFLSEHDKDFFYRLDKLFDFDVEATVYYNNASKLYKYYKKHYSKRREDLKNFSIFLSRFLSFSGYEDKLYNYEKELIKSINDSLDFQIVYQLYEKINAVLEKQLKINRVLIELDIIPEYNNEEEYYKNLLNNILRRAVDKSKTFQKIKISIIILNVLIYPYFLITDFNIFYLISLFITVYFPIYITKDILISNVLPYYNLYDSINYNNLKKYNFLEKYIK